MEPNNGSTELEADSFRHLPTMGKNEWNDVTVLVIIFDEQK